MNVMFHPRANGWSVRVYRMLLLTYPRAFRKEYASEMVLAFRDAYRDATAERGLLGVARLWSDVVCDLVKSAYIEHASDWRNRAGRGAALAGKGQLAMALPFLLDVAHRSDIGRVRASNQDSVLAVVPEDSDLLQAKGALFVVSDGLGGHDRGEVASAMAVERIRAFYYQDSRDDVPSALRDAIERANSAICEEGARTPPENSDVNPMGATCVAAVLRDATLYAANVGDSRAYVLRDGELRQITRDHSLTAQMVERGEITAAEARTHEQRNQIYRALGLREVEVDVFTEPVSEGDTLILCTDGLCGVVEDDELRAIVTQYSPEESAQRLIARANDAGGPDNATVVVVRVGAA